jgi:hypothetical protein
MDGYTIGPAVDFDPFAKPKKSGQKYTLGAPVDFDPFAEDAPAAQVPNELMAAHDQQDISTLYDPAQRRAAEIAQSGSRCKPISALDTFRTPRRGQL